MTRRSSGLCVTCRAEPASEGGSRCRACEHAARERELRRSRRKREVRAVTINTHRLTQREIEIGSLLYPVEETEPRPRVRGECVDSERPCPFVSCRHHLYLDVTGRGGSIKMNFPDLEVEELKESCSLDVADRGGVTLEEVGAIMNLTRERVRQIEVLGLTQLRRKPNARAWKESA